MAAINARSLLTQTTCPHCWHEFAPQDVLFVASHEDLRGDPRLGPDEMLRFRPSRFNAMGSAFDARNLACQDMACPRCHLPIPEVMLTAEPFFVSILGTPGCGKSFYLAALTWELRQLLPSRFALSFTSGGGRIVSKSELVGAGIDGREAGLARRAGRVTGLAFACKLRDLAQGNRPCRRR